MLPTYEVRNGRVKRQAVAGELLGCEHRAPFCSGCGVCSLSAKTVAATRTGVCEAVCQRVSLGPGQSRHSHCWRVTQRAQPCFSPHWVGVGCARGTHTHDLEHRGLPLGAGLGVTGVEIPGPTKGWQIIEGGLGEVPGPHSATCPWAPTRQVLWPSHLGMWSAQLRARRLWAAWRLLAGQC